LIINFLRRYPKSFEEIRNYIEQEFEIHSGEKLYFSKRTFQRDLLLFADDIRIIKPN
jgi:hypothetical protein